MLLVPLLPVVPAAAAAAAAAVDDRDARPVSAALAGVDPAPLAVVGGGGRMAFLVDTCCLAWDAAFVFVPGVDARLSQCGVHLF